MNYRETMRKKTFYYPLFPGAIKEIVRSCVPWDDTRECDCNYKKDKCHCSDSDCGWEPEIIHCECNLKGK